MVLLKLHWDVTEATLWALLAEARGGRGEGAPSRPTEAPTGRYTVFNTGSERRKLLSLCGGQAHRGTPTMVHDKLYPMLSKHYGME